MMSREYWIFAIGVLVYLIYKKGKTIDTETGDGQPQDGSSTSRLRGVAPSNILTPTGRFDCDTLNKLRNVKGVDTISLSMFQPDEEVGFEEFVPTRITNMRYAPSDVDQLNGQKPIY